MLLLGKRYFQKLLAGHLLVALLQLGAAYLCATWMPRGALGTLAKVCILALAVLSLLTPAIGYVWCLLAGSHDVAMDEEPCVSTGDLYFGHWFTFASMPGKWCWTRDHALAARIRARPRPVSAAPAYEFQLESEPPNPDVHVQAAGQSLQAFATFMMVPLGLATLYGMVAAAGNPWMLLYGLFGLIFFVLAPILLFVVLPHMAALGLSVGAWKTRGRLKSFRRLALVDQVLVMDEQRFRLNEDGFRHQMTYDSHGAILTLESDSQRFVIHGEYEGLCQLVDQIELRRRVDGAQSRRQMDAELAPLRLAAKATSGPKVA